MSAAAKLGCFLLLLVAVFAGAYAAGARWVKAQTIKVPIQYGSSSGS